MSRHHHYLIFATTFLVASVSRAVGAQEPAASCTCNAKAGTLVIRYTPDLSEADPPWPAQPRPVHFMNLLSLDAAQTTVRGTRTRTSSCRLKADRLEVTLEPGVPNVNLLGRCGDAVTGFVTVSRNGAVVLKQLEFENLNCHERERMVDRITFTEGSATPDIHHVAYNEE